MNQDRGKDMEGATANRRPLKSRGTGWAAAAARVALASGISADGVSILGIVISIIGAAVLVAGTAAPWHFLVGAVAVQLRLLCNMLDGMVAVEGGRKSLYGPIYNELPDRLEDSLLLIAAGYAAYSVIGFELGLVAALLAAICAYVRLLGGTLGQPQDFCGPQAKPHRMFVLTVGLLAAFLAGLAGWRSGPWLYFAIALICFGTLVTIVRRTLRIARRLRESA
jgi:phosphatidylglycerophosphate synthase